MARRREIVKEVAFPLTREDVVSLSGRMDEPAWLLEKRQQAWALAESIPMPTATDEPWRRTDIRRVRWEETGHLVSPNGAALGDVPGELYAPLIGDRQGGLLIFVNGRPVHRELSGDIAAQGVIFTDLRTAWLEHRELIERYFMTQAVRPDEGKFAALHAALWTHGVFLYVPPGVQIEQPFHSVEFAPGADTTSTHILAVLGDGAGATCLHESASPPCEGEVLHFGVTELIVGADAHLRYVGLQNWSENTVNFGHQRGRVARSGQLDWISGEMGTRLSKVFMTLDLDGDDAWGRISGMYFTHDRQHIDLDTQQNHHALRTTSDLLFKGALKDDSRTVWQGMIVVDPGAQRTDGFQANRNLMLDRSARADSIPGLEIEADDVRCTHAATTGRVDETELFYLMSRGIDRPTATRLIVDGFFDPVMQRIPFEGVRERLQSYLDGKLEA
jgi:Fe-S cluster assembly protein SufD